MLHARMTPEAFGNPRQETLLLCLQEGVSIETKAGEGIKRKRSRGSAGKDEGGWRMRNEVNALKSLPHETAKFSRRHFYGKQLLT